VLSFPQFSPNKTIYTPLLFPISATCPNPPHSSQFDYWNNTGWGVQIIELLITSSYNHSVHIPVLKHYKIKLVTSICNNNIVIPIVTLATDFINIHNKLPLLWPLCYSEILTIQHLKSEVPKLEVLIFTTKNFIRETSIPQGNVQRKPPRMSAVQLLHHLLTPCHLFLQLFCYEDSGKHRKQLWWPCTGRWRYQNRTLW
jgi:hypothetical protein